MTITATPRPIADAPGARASRAAILAGAVLIAGCQSHEPAPIYGGPPPPPTNTSPAPIYGGPPEPDPAIVPDAAAVDAAVTPWTASAPDAAIDAGVRPQHPSMLPMYGGPPHH